MTVIDRPEAEFRVGDKVRLRIGASGTCSDEKERHFTAMDMSRIECRIVNYRHLTGPQGWQYDVLFDVPEAGTDADGDPVVLYVTIDDTDRMPDGGLPLSRPF